jgi:dihydrofolate reductase
MISMIVAMDEANGIGIGNELAWKLPSDMRWFRQMTMGKTVVMGRKTYQSIGRSLQGRTNIVLSRKMKPIQDDDIFVEKHFSVLLDKMQKSENEIVIIGGRKVYEKFFPFVEKIYLTKIHSVFRCDVSLDLELEQFKVVQEIAGTVDENNPFPHTFVVLEKKKQKGEK